MTIDVTKVETETTMNYNRKAPRHDTGVKEKNITVVKVTYFPGKVRSYWCRID